jgi:hypothetical protein
MRRAVCNPTVKPEAFGCIVKPSISGCTVNPSTFGCTVKPEPFGCIVPACNIPITTAASSDVGELITVSGTPQAETATSSGIVDNIGEVFTASGTPQAETATSSGVADSGAAQGSFIWLNPSNILGNQTGVFWANDPSASGGSTYDMEVKNPSFPVTTGTRNGLQAAVSLGQSGGGGQLEVIGIPPLIVAPYTIFVVCGFDSQQNATGLFDADLSLVHRVAIRDGNNGLIELWSITTGVISSISNDTIGHVFAFRMQTGNHRGSIDGSWSTDSTVGDNDYDYGSLLTEINSGLNAGGWVGEVIIFSSALTDADMDWRVNKLKSDWSIT